MEMAMRACKEYGGICEVAISYTTSPVHDLHYFVELATTREEMGADVICIKDMANLLLPFDAFELVSSLKKAVSCPIHLHTHNTTGTGDMTLLKACEAGVDIVDTALSPLANGTSQPATESLVATLKGQERDTGLDLEKLSEAAALFRPVADRLMAEKILDPKVLKIDVKTLLYQVPGGMLSNLISQLKAANAMDKFEDALLETPRVRKDMGYPPLVTPTSQIVGVQAVTNVLVGERYKRVSKEIKAYLRGEYGTPPGPVDQEVLHMVLGDEKPIEGRFADTLEPVFEKAKSELAGKARCDEDVLSWLAFPQVAEKFFAERDRRENSVTAYSIRRMD